MSSKFGARATADRRKKQEWKIIFDRYLRGRNTVIVDDINEFVSEALTDFGKAAVLAGQKFTAEKITFEIAVKPHQQPKELPMDKMAVYAFFCNGQALKVGKVGPKSNARYTSQHYNSRGAPSTLAHSILADPAKAGAIGVSELNVGDWIKQHTDRVNIFMPASFGDPMLSLLESFLHVRWKPRFEGRCNHD